MCDLAPSCTGAVAVPTSTEPLEDCDSGDRTNYACGLDLGAPADDTTCLDPQLRLRIKQIRVTRGNSIPDTHAYCIVSAEDGARSELLVTRRFLVTSRDTTVNLPLSEAVFWGQGNLYRSINNVTLTYECYESKNLETYEGLFGDISDAAEGVADDADGYGWVFGTIAVAGEIISAALGAVEDELWLSVQQTIDAGALLEMTNGRTWTIRSVDEGGAFGIGRYDFNCVLHGLVNACSTTT